MIYLDTSAALKLVMPEAETAGLELWIAERPGGSARFLQAAADRNVAQRGQVRAAADEPG